MIHNDNYRCVFLLLSVIASVTSSLTFVPKPSIACTTQQIEDRLIVTFELFVNNVTPTKQTFVYGSGTCQTSTQSPTTVFTPVGQLDIILCDDGAYVDNDFFLLFTSSYGVCDGRLYFSHIPDYCKKYIDHTTITVDRPWEISNGTTYSWSGDNNTDITDRILLLVVYVACLIIWSEATSDITKLALYSNIHYSTNTAIQSKPYWEYFILGIVTITWMCPLYQTIIYYTYNIPPNSADIHNVNIMLPMVMTTMTMASIGALTIVYILHQTSNNGHNHLLIILRMCIDILIINAIAMNIPMLLGREFCNLIWFTLSVICGISGRDLSLYIYHGGSLYMIIVAPFVACYCGYICMLPQFHHGTFAAVDMAGSIGLSIQAIMLGATWVQVQFGNGR